MNKFYLLLLCSTILLKTIAQPGSLDSSFGNNGILRTAFFNNLNLSSEQVLKVQTGANGNIFNVVRVDYNYARIVRYLPNGRLDSSYGNGGYSNAINLEVTSAAMQEDKFIVVFYQDLVFGSKAV